ncbi:conjugal transfer protein [Acidipropionibacterium acidipropionici]|uniref:Conjugal transfer protein n=2 Tax=Acidipropionibacterium acidipropionici TaxID=1748 RepID=A0AAC9APE2_9ACTN|nr:conjugal transfer protein [Acidipropionibacterium acidipropionici]AOZ48070.1 conjugal transfer protein [Acidipropionibacterium acidipropionici]AZP39486.1 conjugal transfer protein [Acidipropionibacterium acidipropionici]
MRVMSAGDGYKYLLRTVAAGDGNRSLSTPLTRYYNAEGTPPGRWMGSGLPALGTGQVTSGDEVSEAQLQLLVGMGRDPVTGAPLGRAYPVYKTVTQRIEERTATLDQHLDPAARARAIAAIEAEEAERGTRRAVAGFDFTFSIPKSASVLWAVADAGTQSLIAQAHHDAVADMIAFMEREVAATRTGTTAGDGAVAQVDVRGVIATAYDHYDSRAGDSHLHTHVVISNKVQTVLDGKWRSLDSRPMHGATVALSELHEAVFADHLTRMLGVEWEARARGRDRNPAWAITEVPEELVEEFSTRARHIDEVTDRLIDTYVAGHGRRPSAATIMKLRAQATLSTRPEKTVHSLADLTAAWRNRATAVLGQDATGWARRVAANEQPLLLRADDISLDVVRALGENVVAAVGEKRSTWRRWNLTAEAARQTMDYRFATTQDREAIVALVVDAAEAVSLRLTPFELASSPAAFRRPDATSVFRPKNSTIYSSHQLLDAEDRLLERSHDTTGPTVSLRTMERIARRPDSDGRVLGEDQSDALVRIAVSGRVLDVLVGPAGAGKTTAMNALRRAWETEHGAGSVVGLAPSAGAAQVLAEDLGIPTENTAKWWQSHQTTGATFNAGQLVIVDEASLAGTLSLDRITRLAAEEGAKVLLVGDHAQLQAVDAGGSFGLLVHDRGDAPELVDVHRFTHAWEKTASLDLRHGRTDVIDSYDAHGRIHDGETEEMIDSAYTAWRADLLAGKSTVLVSDSNESVTALNTRARTDLILDGAVRGPREVDLHDGTRAATGDVVITRRNDRRLRAGRGWVRNGDRWNVMDVRDDGSMALQRAGAKWGATVIVPADYVAEHVELGYAVTSYRAQGITTDTAHVLVDSAMTRENLYVAMTRGRDANIAYVAVDQPDTAHDIPHPGDNQAATGRSVLYGVVQHAGAELSAHETIAAEQETWGSIAQLAAEYETIAAAAQHDRWATLIQNSGLTETQAADVLASDAFGPLTAELRRAEANHHDVDVLLPKLVRARRLDNADDVAAVLHHRVAMATARPAGSGRTRKTPRLIAGLIPEATGSMSDEMRQALNERRDLIEARADAVLDNALAEAAPWTAELGPRPTNVEKLATWRHSARVVAAYRDRYQVITEAAIGTQAETIGQKIDAARAQAALDAVRRLAASSMPMEKVQTAAPSSGRFL